MDGHRLEPAARIASGCVIVGLDRSDRSRDAAALGRILALAGSGRIVLCSVTDADAADAKIDPDELARTHADSLQGLQNPRVLILPAATASRGLDRLARDEQAGVIVVGSTHRGVLGGLVPGGVASRLLAGAPCAIAVAPAGYAEQAQAAIEKVGVAYDGTVESDWALATAAAAATKLGAELVLYHATHEIPEDASWDKFRGHVHDYARSILDAGCRQLPAGVKVSTRVLEGPVADVIAEAAQNDEVGLLYTGSRGYGPLREALFGGVAGALLRIARCPLVIVPPDDR